MWDNWRDQQWKLTLHVQEMEIRAKYVSFLPTSFYSVLWQKAIRFKCLHYNLISAIIWTWTKITECNNECFVAITINANYLHLTKKAGGGGILHVHSIYKVNYFVFIIILVEKTLIQNKYMCTVPYYNITRQYALCT